MIRWAKVRESEYAQLLKATPGAAGWDLFYAPEVDIPVVLEQDETAVLQTGIAIEINENEVAHVASRSGLAFKHGIHVLNGVGIIDSDYRGEISVLLHKVTPGGFLIAPGMRIAQLIVYPVSVSSIKEVHLLELSETRRGAGGFGSTGL